MLIDGAPAPVRHRRSGGAAAISLFTHAALLVLAVAIHRTVPPPPPSEDRANLTPLVWQPRPDPGGGRGGGNRQPAPPRRAEAAGRDRITVAVAPRPDLSLQEELPADELPRPTLDAVPLAADPTEARGALQPESATASDSRGPGDGSTAGPGGHGDGSSRGPNVGDDAYGIGNGVSAPRLIRSVNPEYTADAMRARVQGLVALECVVDAAGRVDRCRVRRSLDPVYGLDQQALAAARRWTFAPGTLDGKAVPVRITIELAFHIR